MFQLTDTFLITADGSEQNNNLIALEVQRAEL
jgi:hypothetical protein